MLTHVLNAVLVLPLPLVMPVLHHILTLLPQLDRLCKLLPSASYLEESELEMKKGIIGESTFKCFYWRKSIYLCWQVKHTRHLFLKYLLFLCRWKWCAGPSETLVMVDWLRENMWPCGRKLHWWHASWTPIGPVWNELWTVAQLIALQQRPTSHHTFE